MSKASTLLSDSAFELAEVGLAELSLEQSFTRSNSFFALLFKCSQPISTYSLKDFLVNPKDPRPNTIGKWVCPEIKFEDLISGKSQLIAVETSMKALDGRELFIGLKIKLLQDSNQKPLGFFLTLIDLTQRKIEEDALIYTLVSSGISVWEDNFELDQRIQTDNHLELMGYHGDPALFSKERFIERLYPDDREKVFKNFAAVFEQGVARGQEYRMVWPDGSVHWIMSKAYLFKNAKWQATRVKGICQDVTPLRNAEAQLKSIGLERHPGSR